MSTTTPRPARSRALRSLALALAALLVLAGCGIRLDSEPEGPSPATVTEQWRQDAAVEAANLASAARDLAGSPATDPAAYPALSAVAEGLEAQAEALGGIWVAWPDGPPEGATNRPVAEPPTVSDVGQLRGLLRSSADRTVAVLEDVPVAERDLASVLAATAAGRLLQARSLDAFAEGGTPVEVTAPTAGLVAAVADGPTVLVLDQARYLEETLAARDIAEDALPRAQELQVLLDAALAAGAPDTREPAYPWPDGGPDEFRAVTEGDLLDQWIFLTGTAPAAQRGPLVHAAADAALRLLEVGVDAGPLPGLPGSTGLATTPTESPTGESPTETP